MSKLSYLLVLYLHLVEEREKGKRIKKINHHGEAGFPLGWTCLAGCAICCNC
jgi:hypothetical protein